MNWIPFNVEVPPEHRVVATNGVDWNSGWLNKKRELLSETEDGEVLLTDVTHYIEPDPEDSIEIECECDGIYRCKKCTDEWYDNGGYAPA